MIAEDDGAARDGGKEGGSARAQKGELAYAVAAAGDRLMSLVIGSFGVRHSSVYDRVTNRQLGARWLDAWSDDANLCPRIRQIAAQRLTYGYRRIAAVFNR